MPHPDKVYPTALTAPEGKAVIFEVKEGETLLFSGTHLHGTQPHDSGITRFSLEMRTVYLPMADVMARIRRLDSRCQGSTLDELVAVPSD